MDSNSPDAFSGSVDTSKPLDAASLYTHYNAYYTSLGVDTATAAYYAAMYAAEYSAAMSQYAKPLVSASAKSSTDASGSGTIGKHDDAKTDAATISNKNNSSTPFPEGHPANTESNNGVPYPVGYTPNKSKQTGSSATIQVRSKRDATKLSTGVAPKSATTAAISVGKSNPTSATHISASAQSTADTVRLDPIQSTKRQKRLTMRVAGGKVWSDPTMLEWDENDYRLFCGDIGNEVSDDLLTKSFSKYPSMLRAHVVRDKNNQSKGFGFVSFKDPEDFVKAMREMNGKL
ncbi:hypothetical protein RTP6_006633 [Batrachochytrium dendrobatidis]